jgi:hypothetical protein
MQVNLDNRGLDKLIRPYSVVVAVKENLWQIGTDYELD